jgi:hypothetical protein
VAYFEEHVSFSPHIQKHIIMAWFVLYNFIRDSNLRDKKFERCDANERYLVPSTSGSVQTEGDGSEDVENEDTMNIIRTRSLMIWLVREKDSYVEIYHNCMSSLSGPYG